MQFDPVIVPLGADPIQDVKDMVESDNATEVTSNGMKFVVAKLKGDKGKEWYGKGTKPRLIV